MKNRCTLDGTVWHALSDNLRWELDESLSKLSANPDDWATVEVFSDSPNLYNSSIILLHSNAKYGGAFVRLARTYLNVVAEFNDKQTAYFNVGTAAEIVDKFAALGKKIVFIICSIKPNAVEYCESVCTIVRANFLTLPKAIRRLGRNIAYDPKRWLSQANPNHLFKLVDALQGYMGHIDQRSIPVLEALLRFRLTFDASYLRGIALPEEEQYISILGFPPRPGSTIVDGGAFDGDTALRFARALSEDVHAIYCFEPDPASFSRLKNVSQALQYIVPYQYGLSNKDEDLCFSALSTTGSYFTHLGNTTLPVVRLDGMKLPNVVDFIKLDVEGFEMRALEGARDTIVRDKPRLAISAYHDPLDIIKIPQWVSTLEVPYVGRLLHHSNFMYESVWHFEVAVD